SSVGPDRFRFDFTHFSRVEGAALNEIETLVNDRIRDNVSVEKEEMDAEEAFKSGATALFEEKYGDRVRVISLSDFSRELCGGTHTRQTGDIGLFKIVSESSVASGVRRIEAVTGPAAVVFVQQTTGLLHESALLLREKAETLPQRIEKLLKQQKDSEKEIEKLKDRISELASEKTGEEFKTINGTTVLVKRVEVESPAALRVMADRFKDKMSSGVVVLGGVSSGKALLIATVTKDLKGKFHAGNIIKHAATVLGGGGGGRPDMAQAGGPQTENLDKALAAALELIEKA
ncbi:MAG: DHHA1 domain-containing protein, partial [Deltaproteobacteria bacterium]